MFFNHFTFNIIFIPGTVAYQSLGLLSLLINSNLKLRLVGNALDINEATMLQKISETSSRLTCTNFESDQIIPHGTLLDVLFLSENDKYFCFCDSDIFLFNSLSEKNIKKNIGRKDVFSSGGRIENEDDGIYAGFRGGATTKSPDGKIDLATSFFCIYKRKPIEKILHHYKVGFEQYRIDSQIPKAAMQVVNKLKLSYDMFDTGKLLSVLLHYEGCQKVFEDIDELIHIGGMSGRYLQNMDASKAVVLDDTLLKAKKSTQDNDFNVRNDYEKSLKKFYGRYYYCYLNYLINKGAEPIINSSDQRIQKTIERLNHHLNKIVKQAKNDVQLNKVLTIITQ